MRDKVGGDQLVVLGPGMERGMGYMYMGIYTHGGFGFVLGGS